MQFESVQLFVARTHQHQPKFNITSENTGVIVEICTMLDGIPLALELAAATLRQVTLDEMVSLLRGRDWVKKITTPARDLPQRQRTLENVIDWSYTLLADEQKEFFCKLGVFSGWFDAEAATVVCETESQKPLNVLTDHSMLVSEVFKGKTHWRMLELIHDYARSKMSAIQLVHVEQLRVDHFLQRLQDLKKDSTEIQRADFFHLNVNNLHAALKWVIAGGQTKPGLELSGLLEEYWSLHGYFKEGHEFMRALFTLPDDGEPLIRADRLQMASDLAWQQHDFETAIAYSREAVELGRQYGLKGKYSAYINRLGRIYIEQERLDEAKQLLQEGLQLAYQEPENLKPGVPLAQLGEIALFEGRLEEAKKLLEQSLSHQNEMIFIAMAKTDLAEIALAEGDYEKARDWLEKALPAASQHTRRFIVFLCALAGYFVLSGRSKANVQKVAQLYGAVESLNAKSGIQFNSFYRHLNQERMKRAREKLSAGEWQRAYETGRGWERGEAIQQAKGILGL